MPISPSINIDSRNNVIDNIFMKMLWFYLLILKFYSNPNLSSHTSSSLQKKNLEI